MASVTSSAVASVVHSAPSSSLRLTIVTDARRRPNLYKLGRRLVKIGRSHHETEVLTPQRASSSESACFISEKPHPRYRLLNVVFVLSDTGSTVARVNKEARAGRNEHFALWTPHALPYGSPTSDRRDPLLFRHVR